MDEIMSKLSELSLEELSTVAKEALARIYSKLRDEENFGYYQHCFVTSMGSESYEVSACVIDTDNGHNQGQSWDSVYWL